MGRDEWQLILDRPGDYPPTYNEVGEPATKETKHQRTQARASLEELRKESNRKVRHKDRQRTWYKENRERQIEKARARYEADPEGRKAYISEWGKRNPEKRAQYDKAWKRNRAAGTTKPKVPIGNR